ncbi:antibiotic biosynthesis monooxygenase family protein [Deinococcus apachensis]|uniref:antibiotic biosynthesis monooxygenase family protein n=1 Tax=Deinococcus apachensis TaxID=309886 RepID=UPI003CCC4253
MATCSCGGGAPSPFRLQSQRPGCPGKSRGGETPDDRRIHPLPGGKAADALESPKTSARAALDASPHCLGHERSRCVEEPAHSILRTEWDSLPGHLEGFRHSPEFRTSFRDVRPFVNDIEERRHDEVTAIQRRWQGVPGS